MKSLGRQKRFSFVTSANFIRQKSSLIALNVKFVCGTTIITVGFSESVLEGGHSFGAL